ncbi:MAG: LPS assembly lipoprotein LptE [Pseudomonadota bacterium]
MTSPSPALRRLLSRLWLPLALFGFAGCSHYQLGTGGTLAFRTVYAAPIENRTLLPQAHALVSTALREEFLRDGRVALVDSPGQADVTLTLTLTDYHRDVATVRPGDTGLARKFALTLGATVTLHDNRTGKDLFVQRPVDAVRDAYTDGGQLQSEYQDLPLLAGVLAKKVAHAALDVW